MCKATEDPKKLLKQLLKIDKEFQKYFGMLGYEPGNSECIGESHGWLFRCHE